VGWQKLRFPQSCNNASEKGPTLRHCRKDHGPGRRSGEDFFQVWREMQEGQRRYDPKNVTRTIRFNLGEKEDGGFGGIIL